VAIAVAVAVAKKAEAEGLTDVPPERIEDTVRHRMWSPRYLPYRRSAG
jgi:malate dehydrogenase (oxaloacetate-decarboxylating)